MGCFHCIKLLGHRFIRAGSPISFMIKTVFNAQCGKYSMVLMHLGRMSNRKIREYFHPLSALYCTASSIYQVSRFQSFLLLFPHGLSSKLPRTFSSVSHVLKIWCNHRKPSLTHFLVTLILLEGQKLGWGGLHKGTEEKEQASGVFLFS